MSEAAPPARTREGEGGAAPELVAALVAARRALERAARGGPRFDGIRRGDVAAPGSAADAYAIQDAVARELGWFAGKRPCAWKVGAASREATPEAAPLPLSGVVSSPATLASRAFTTIGVEGELAFRLGAEHAIAELVVTLEVVAPRFGDLGAMPALLRLADQGVHGALVVGSGVAWRGPIDWATQVALVRRNGIAVSETHGGHPLGDLRFLLAWLVSHAASRGLPLAAGDVVTAGTWTGLVPAQAGETVSVEFPGIGSASVTLA